MVGPALVSAAAAVAADSADAGATDSAPHEVVKVLSLAGEESAAASEDAGDAGHTGGAVLGANTVLKNER